MSALNLQATTKEVKVFFSKLQVTHLPVVDRGQFLGCISLEDSETMEESKKLSDYLYLLSRMAIAENATWIDILQEFSWQNSNILPVLNQEKNT